MRGDMKKDGSRVVVIIPARYGSTRFEGKPLAIIDGRPMIQHVYQRSKEAEFVDDVIVATDDARVMNAVMEFNGKVMMTSPRHKCGTDRIAEIAERIDAEIIVNVQGDEPLISPRAIDEVVAPLKAEKNLKMCTLMKKITDQKELHDPDVVKVVTDRQGYALYFSRSMIPYPRDAEYGDAYKHIGVYVYRKDFLLQFSKMEQTPLERCESLEQLRALENGIRIKVIETGYDSISVDRPGDLEEIKKLREKKII
jgi:3-deoxy-manno-octulosonate cytidylyltransferase (CMP-KDO synthetase)